MKHIIFEPVDTIFLRDSRPFDPGGTNYMESMTMPTAQTMQGAVRTLIGEHSKVNWAEFNDYANGKYERLRAEIGDSSKLGRLKLGGPYLMMDGERLYPAPLHLIRYKGDDGCWHFDRLRPDAEAVECDLGKIHLPRTSVKRDDVKTLAGSYLTGIGMECLLRGEIPGEDMVVAEKDILGHEPRVGIARDNQSRANKTGMLYFASHLRFKPEKKISYGMAVCGIDDNLLPDKKSIFKFGGEGRTVCVSVKDDIARLPAPTATGKTKGLILTLLTHGNFGGGWQIDLTWFQLCPRVMHLFEVTFVPPQRKRPPPEPERALERWRPDACGFLFRVA
jgi:CRISPR-associated protein Cmr3